MYFCFALDRIITVRFKIITMTRSGYVTWILTLVFCGLFAFMSAQQKSEEDIIWHVKAIHPSGNTMDVKAFNNKGESFPEC